MVALNPLVPTTGGVRGVKGWMWGIGEGPLRCRFSGMGRHAVQGDWSISA